MKALELLKSQEQLLLDSATQGKKTKVLAANLNQLMIEMNNQINSFQEFYNSQLNGDLANKIIIAKSLAEYFAGNKLLKVELAVEGLRNQEKAKMAEYYAVKTKLLDVIKTLLKEVAKEAVVSNYDVFDEGNFVKCEPGHEIIILGDRNIDVLETLLKELDEQLTIEGCFESIPSQPVDFNLSTLNRNIELCNRKANEIYGAKAGKLSKVEAFISKFEEVGNKVVAFYTYKSALLEIGCAEKAVRDYEHELSKAYVPLKKTLSKELRTELEDICSISVNEAEYPSYSVEEPVPSTPVFDNSFEPAAPSVDNNLFTEQTTTPSVDNNLFTEPVETPTPSVDNNLFTEPVNNNPANNQEDPFEVFGNQNNTAPTSPFANSPFGSNNNNDDNNIF